MNLSQKKIALALCLLAFCFLALAQNKTEGPDYTSLIEKYRNILQEEIRKNNIAGLSVALVDGDSLVWCEGFGFYNIQNKTQVTGHTPFNIGSICKTFTGLAVMQLQEDKKLNIDGPYCQPMFEWTFRFVSMLFDRDWLDIFVQIITNQICQLKATITNANNLSILSITVKWVSSILNPLVLKL